MRHTIWSAMPGDSHNNYLISIDGDIYSLIRFRGRRWYGGHKLKTRVTNNGYELAPICINGKPGDYTVHRRVGIAFIPNPQNLPEINHLDRDKLNNNMENLEWSTKHNNSLHARDGLTGVNGGLATRALTMSDAQAIRSRYSKGVRGRGYIAISNDYGVSPATIKNIVTGRLYREHSN